MNEIELLDMPVISGIDHENCDIVVNNDDYNSFDHVIECFCSILGHTNEQAEQLALLIHTKGSARVKHGTFEELQPLAEALIDQGLDATIE